MTDDTFANWLRANPAPDLQQLVARHGGYDKVSPEAWTEFDRAMADWQERRRWRLEDDPAGDLYSDGAAADPERLCICGLPGVYWRPRKGGKPGGKIWRCEEHRNQWPDYTDDIPRAAE